ncbi:MAG: nascent polypeptide-associated complex protein [archaeon]
MDVRNLQKIMKQMSTEELDAEKVEIFLADGRKLVVERPAVVKMQVMGQTTFQVSGEVSETGSGTSPERSTDDARVVAEASGKTEEEAGRALEETGGDIAAAIIKFEGWKHELGAAQKSLTSPAVKSLARLRALLAEPDAIRIMRIFSFPLTTKKLAFLFVMVQDEFLPLTSAGLISKLLTLQTVFGRH